MASLKTVNETVRMALGAFLPPQMTSDESLVLLFAIGLQESRFEHTHQIGGPAHGWWQFEKNGACINVMTHRATKELAKKICAELHVPFTHSAIFAELETNVNLATCFARLELYTNPNPLPAIGKEHTAWDYYLRTWRPGHPHPKTWSEMYWRSVGFVTG